MIVEFHYPEDALIVAEHLHNAEVKENFLFCWNADRRAIEFAIELSGVENYCFGNHHFCLLPFKPRWCADDVPQIYVACLEAYNSGRLHGMWIDATQDEDDIQADIDYMLSYSPVIELHDDPDYLPEEWSIDDYSDFGSIRVDNMYDLEKISRIANAIEEHGDALHAYFEQFGSDADLGDFGEYFIGCYDSAEDFIYERLEDDGTLQKLEECGFNENWIDYDAIKDWWEHDSYEFCDYEGNTYVFHTSI